MPKKKTAGASAGTGDNGCSRCCFGGKKTTNTRWWKSSSSSSSAAASSSSCTCGTGRNFVILNYNNNNGYIDHDDDTKTMMATMKERQWMMKNSFPNSHSLSCHMVVLWSALCYFVIRYRKAITLALPLMALMQQVRHRQQRFNKIHNQYNINRLRSNKNKINLNDNDNKYDIPTTITGAAIYQHEYAAIQQRDRESVTMDILSIGSMTRPEYLIGQINTWVQHSNIRSFVGVTELDDYDPYCATNLTQQETLDYIQQCRAGPTNGSTTTGSNNRNADGDMDDDEQHSSTSSYLNGWSEDAIIFAQQHYSHSESKGLPKDYVIRDSPGWICAQRRFLQGIYKALKPYHNYNNGENNGQELPDYLVVVDDDTMFYPEKFLKEYGLLDPVDSEPKIYAGCLFEQNLKANIRWEFPYGGFGTIFNKATLQRLVQPINCNVRDKYKDPFNARACDFITENSIGEMEFFKEGMSISNLYSTYASHSRNLCLHSDWLIGYMAKIVVEEHQPGGASSATVFYPMLIWPNQCGNHSYTDNCNLVQPTADDIDIGDDGVSINHHMFCHNQNPTDQKIATELILAREQQARSKTQNDKRSFGRTAPLIVDLNEAVLEWNKTRTAEIGSMIL